MATVYPTPLPESVLHDAARDAERKVYEALARLLGPDHAVFYSVAWLTRATGHAAHDGEADFVIAHSDLGVLVLEVKGGRIGHDQATGEWHSTDRHDHCHPIRDPFAQATSSHHALEAKLKEHPVIRRFYVRIGHGVVFPDSANPHRPLTPNAEPAITVFAEDLDHIDACVRRMFDYWAGSMGKVLAPAPGFVQAVTDLLAPRFELPRSLGAAIKGDDRELLRLTEDQFRVLDLLSRARRVAVSGGAGTGKTMLALEKARRLAAEGLEVLLTCYNRPLADYLKQAAGPCERLTIANYHTLCWDMAKAAGHPFPDTSVADPPPGFWERTLPDALLAALDALPRRFDAIIIDEGQDFLDSWWDPLLLSLADLHGGIVYVFYDDNQKLYRRSNAFPAGMLEIPLRDNLRNTRRISALTEQFYQGPPMRALGPEGQDVERSVIRDASEIERQVSRVLHRLIKENSVAPADIAVLMGSGRTCPLQRGQRIGAFETTTDQAAEPSKVLLETVRRFKGLERQVVILTAIDDLPAAEETALLYCGLSRARAHLVIVATEKTIEWVCGRAGDLRR
jgi:hypothetical protein